MLCVGSCADEVEDLVSIVSRSPLSIQVMMSCAILPGVVCWLWLCSKIVIHYVIWLDEWCLVLDPVPMRSRTQFRPLCHGALLLYR